MSIRKILLIVLAALNVPAPSSAQTPVDRLAVEDSTVLVLQRQVDVLETIAAKVTHIEEMTLDVQSNMVRREDVDRLLARELGPRLLHERAHVEPGVRRAVKPSLRAASCCSVDVVKGAAGLRRLGLRSTDATVSLPAAAASRETAASIGLKFMVLRWGKRRIGQASGQFPSKKPGFCRWFF